MTMYIYADEKPIPWDIFRERVLALYTPEMRAKATLARVRNVLDLLRAQGAQTTADLTIDLIAGFITSRPESQSPHTIRSLLVCARTICNFAVKLGGLRMNPFDLRGPSQWVRCGRPKGKKYHAMADIVRVLDLARRDVEVKPEGWSRWRAQRLYALLATAAYTGMRRGEALHLMVEDLDFRAGLIFIVARQRLKTYASDQPVPMPPALAPILTDWLQHRLDGPYDRKPLDTGWTFPTSDRMSPWTSGAPGDKPLDRLVALGQRAGVEGFTFHSLRHSLATHAIARWGMTHEQVKTILRHTTIRTQEHYLHADGQNLRELGARITYELPSPTPPEPPTS